MLASSKDGAPGAAESWVGFWFQSVGQCAGVSVFISKHTATLFACAVVVLLPVVPPVDTVRSRDTHAVCSSMDTEGRAQVRF